MSRFPTELRRWRTARRMSQLELAARAGTTQRHVSFIEQGRARPGRSIVMRLSESLDLTLRERNELLAAAADVTLAELHREAFLPADDRTADVLRRRWG